MRFADIKTGDWFEYRKGRYMRISGGGSNTSLVNAVSLTSGDVLFIDFSFDVNVFDKPHWARPKPVVR